MAPFAPSDLSGLAAAAQTAGPELRGLLLRIGARSFVDGRGRDPGAAARFEALALGLIPLATSDILAEVAATLRRAPDAPASVTALLAERLDLGEAERDLDLARAAEGGLSPWETHALATLGRPEIDRALARNEATTLDGAALRLLVDRARFDRALARSLLARPEPTLPDRAALYRHADGAERARLRGAFTAAWRAGPRPPQAVADRLRATVERVGAAGDPAGLWAALAEALALPAGEPPATDEPAGAELLALALRAAGLSPDESLRALLTLDAPFARSVPALFSLAEIVRAVPAAAARRLLGVPDRPALAMTAPDSLLGARARAAATRTRLSVVPAPPAGAEGASVLPDRRSRSATGRDRT